MNLKEKLQEHVNEQRKYPRRSLNGKVGVLCHGSYFIAEGRSLGEGGMSFATEMVLSEGNVVVTSFQIPGGNLVFVKATIIIIEKTQGDPLVTHSLKFESLDFSHKRQIRAFVAQNRESAR